MVYFVCSGAECQNTAEKGVALDQLHEAKWLHNWSGLSIVVPRTDGSLETKCDLLWFQHVIHLKISTEGGYQIEPHPLFGTEPWMNVSWDGVVNGVGTTFSKGVKISEVIRENPGLPPIQLELPTGLDRDVILYINAKMNE